MSDPHVSDTGKCIPVGDLGWSVEDQFFLRGNGIDPYSIALPYDTMEPYRTSIEAPRSWFK